MTSYNINTKHTISYKSKMISSNLYRLTCIRHYFTYILLLNITYTVLASKRCKLGQLIKKFLKFFSFIQGNEVLI